MQGDEAQARVAYDQIVSDLVQDGAQASQMFGMPCLKIAGKAFAGYFHGDMVFKLRGEDHARALALPGAALFDPSERGRPMKEWVHVPASSIGEWNELGRSALRAVPGAV